MFGPKNGELIVAETLFLGGLMLGGNATHCSPPFLGAGSGKSLSAAA